MKVLEQIVCFARLHGMTLGAALYSNVRVEKRNRIAEIIAASIPAKASGWGRVYGDTPLRGHLL